MGKSIIVSYRFVECPDAPRVQLFKRFFFFFYDWLVVVQSVDRPLSFLHFTYFRLAQGEQLADAGRQ